MMFSRENLEPVVYKNTKFDSIQLALTLHINNATMESHVKLLQQYVVQLRSKDGVEPTTTDYTALTVTKGNAIALEFTDSFQYGRLWEGLLLGTNCEGIPLSDSFDLSTHEIHNVSVDQNTMTNQLNLTWNFINGSNALGTLIVSYPLMYDSDIRYDIILRPTSHAKTQTALLGSVSGKRYNISMFTLLENGRPFTRSVARPFTVTLSGDHQLFNNPSLITVHTTSTENSVCVTCFIDSSSNGTCLLVAHPKPSLLHSQGGLSNVDVLLLNRSGNHSASGCIRGISHINHVIAAFLYDETQIIQGPAFVVRPQDTDATLATSDRLWIILISAFVGIITVSVLTLVVIISIRLVAVHQKKRIVETQHDREPEIEMKKCDAYEVPRLARQKIQIERNPAYETVGARNRQV